MSRGLRCALVICIAVKIGRRHRAGVIDLDHLSSTPLHADVRTAMQPWQESRHGNPSQLHQIGLAAAQAVAEARAQVAAWAHVREDEVVFTSGGTEAANMALCGVMWRHGPGSIVCSCAEHPAVMATARFLEGQGHTLVLVPVDGEGKMDPDDVRKALRPDTRLVAIHLSNHDAGAVQDVAAVAAITREAGVRLFCDGSTGCGWVDHDMSRAGVDMWSVTPHRFYGPQGVGMLIVRRGLELEPLIHGGRQEQGRRAGTEHVAGIVGAGAACATVQRDGRAWVAEAAALRDHLWQGMQSAISCLHLHGPAPGPHRDPRHLSVGIEGVEGEALMLLMDLRGVAVTAASGCLSGAEKYSQVLQAMKVTDELVRGTILLSPATGQSKSQMDEAVQVMARAVAKIRTM
jgi:cysteine desulfurase